MIRKIRTKISDWLIETDDMPTVFICMVISSVAAGFIAGTFNIAVAIAVFFGLAAIVRSL